jgi:hypothetical protein
MRSTRYAPGDVVIADVPFFDDPARSKPRPAVVIRHDGTRVTIQAVYTAPSSARRPIRADRTNGLSHDSHLDPRTVTLPSGSVLRLIGHTNRKAA